MVLLRLRQQNPLAFPADKAPNLHLLREDPVTPILQFGWGGRPPAPPAGPGLGVSVDEAILDRHTVRREVVNG